MLVQLFLCVGLPFLILPILATAAYSAFCWFKAKKNKPVVRDAEKGELVLNPPRQDSEIESSEPQHMMTPAPITSSVQLPFAFGQNF